MPSSPPRPLKVFIYAVDGAGHLNACVGMAQALQTRGHRIIFLLNSAFKGQYSNFGFDEILLEVKQPQFQQILGSKNEQSEETNLLKDSGLIILKSGVLGPKSPVEKLRDKLDKGVSAY